MKPIFGAVIALAIAAAGSAVAVAQPEPPSPRPAEPEPEFHLIPEAIDRFVEDFARNAPGLETIAKGTLRRARRAISIGPTVGFYGAAQPSPGELDAAVTFGIGLELFKIPVLPTRENFKKLVMERVKVKLKKIVLDDMRGREVHPFQVREMAYEIWTEAAREILGMDNIRPKRMEKPRLTVAGEGNFVVSSGTWAARFRMGVGVWKLTLGASIGAAFTDPEISVFAGGELVAHFLTSKGARASVVDVFVRGDFEVRHRDVANTDTVVLGVRYLLDIL